jgi:hypothetical protein
MPIKDTFEMLIKIFHRDRTQLMEDAPDLHAIISSLYEAKAISTKACFVEVCYAYE